MVLALPSLLIYIYLYRLCIVYAVYYSQLRGGLHAIYPKKLPASYNKQYNM
jgi:hypothetical protein